MFIQLGDKKYQLPDTVTIGRGEPFSTDDRSLARNHARLILKNGQWKIKALSSDAPVTINGEPLKAGKFRSLALNDKVLLGQIPLQVFESLPVGEFTGVRKIKLAEQRDYSALLYGSVFLSASSIVFLNSRGDTTSDIVTILGLAFILKLLGEGMKRIGKKVLPYRIATELLSSPEGMTFTFADGTNFSLRFFNIKRWQVVGKLLLVTAYGKNLIFLLPEDSQEVSRILRNRCLSRQHRGRATLPWMSMVPILFALGSVIALSSFNQGAAITLAHFFGILSSLGLLAYLFIEDLRELLPLPVKFSPLTQKAIYTGLLAITLLTQITHLRGPRKPGDLLISTLRCGLTHMEYGQCPGQKILRLPASRKSVP